MDWNKILNWRLLAGSHRFPGPDGGTCISEAAVVAAGFKYRKINSSFDCPSCFSRPIATYAIRLNDTMPDELRQELLMPFVTRLAVTRDSDEVEIKRVAYIVIQTIRRILSRHLRTVGLEKEAHRCEEAEDLLTAFACARAAVRAAENGAAVYTARSATFAAYGAARAAKKTDGWAGHAEFSAALAASAVLEAACIADQREAFTVATQILDEVITLGKRHEPIETSLAIARMEAIKQCALEHRGFITLPQPNLLEYTVSREKSDVSEC